MTAIDTTELAQYRDYGYRAWADIQPGDHVILPVEMVRVLSVTPIPAEHTLTGDHDYLRVIAERPDGKTVTAAYKRHTHTTVYYRTDRFEHVLAEVVATSDEFNRVAADALAELARWESEGGSLGHVAEVA